MFDVEYTDLATFLSATVEKFKAKCLTTDGLFA